MTAPALDDFFRLALTAQYRILDHLIDNTCLAPYSLLSPYFTSEVFDKERFGEHPRASNLGAWQYTLGRQLQYGGAVHLEVGRTLVHIQTSHKNNQSVVTQAEYLRMLCGASHL